MIHKLLIFLFIAIAFNGFSQQREIDSINRLLQSYQKNDTVRLSMLTQRALRYTAIDPEKSLELINENIAVAKAIGSDSHLAKSYNCKGLNFEILGKDSLAVYWYLQGYQLARKISNTIIEMSALNQLGNLYNSRSEYQKSLKYRLKVLDIAMKRKDALRISGALSNVGTVYLSLADFSKASGYFFKALKYADDADSDMYRASAYQSIALVFKNTGDLKRSINYSKKAEAIFRKSGDNQSLGSVFGNMASAYDDAGNPEKALELYMKALAIAEKIKDRRLEASNLSNIGIVYNGLKEYDKAYSYLLKAKSIYEETQNINAMSIVLSELSVLYLKCSDASLQKFGIQLSDRYLKAELVCTEALRMSREIGAPDREAFIQEKLADIYERQGRVREALIAFKSYKSLSDSIASSEAKEEIARKEIQFEADKKQALAQTEIQRQKVIKFGTASASGVVLISGLFFFIGYRKRRNAKEIQKELFHKAMISDTEMRVLRLQMNPHFIFNSLNSISDYIGKNDIKTADYYLSKFAKLMRGILESSEEKEIPLADELKMLELYMALEASRLNNQFVYEINVDHDIDTEITMIPPLILQPFVENSIWHGMKNKNGNGKIIIEVTRKDMLLHCAVEDNGGGIENALKSSKSLGMKITRDRIEMLNKLQNANASINLIDLEKGTRVEVNLPLSEDDI